MNIANFETVITMIDYAIFLRAINVGGTGKLAMSDLRLLCEKAGFHDVRTYIQSGNVVMKSDLPESGVKAALEKRLAEKVGKPIGILVRSAPEIEAALKKNPFKKPDPSRVLVLFLNDAPGRGALRDVVAPGGEELVLKGRELFIHFPDGMGRSKLKVPFADVGTGRNLNTVNKIFEMMEDLLQSTR